MLYRKLQSLVCEQFTRSVPFLTKSKKAISPVVATALLLVVAVVAVVAFQGWFQTYFFGMFGKVETQSNSQIGNTQIENLIGYTLYFKNGGITNITINKVKIDVTDCNISGNYSPGISEIDLGTCLDNLYTNTPEVVAYTNNGIYSKKVYLKDHQARVYLPCSLNGGDAPHGSSFLFYNSSSLPFGGNCSLNSLSRVCNDGVYGENSSFQYISCSLVGQDITPNVFNFTNQSGVNLSTVITSNTLIPTGYEGSVSVSISGDGNPQLSVAGGSWTTSSTIIPGQNITLRLNSSSNPLNTSIVTLIFGNYSVNWSVITRDLDLIPDVFSFTNQTNVSISTLITSNVVTPTGYDGSLNISIQGHGTPQLSVAGGPWSTNAIITLGQNVSIRLNSSYAIGTTRIAQLNFGTYSVNWSVNSTHRLVEYLVVAGGGGSSQCWNGWCAGGGGAGGVLQGSNYALSSSSYSIIVAGMGAAGAQGSNSSFANLIAAGGGYGGDWLGSAPSIGGSGGGGCSGRGIPGANGTVGQGNRGGLGGGGGAGGIANVTEVGGIGINSTINGSIVTYGRGGGADGSTPLTPNSGNGGNHGPNCNCAGGTGGASGIVVVKYLGSPVATGGNITSYGGYTIHTFTTNGTLSFTSVVDTSISSDIIFTNLTNEMINSLVVSNTVFYNSFGNVANISIVGNGSPQFSIDGGAWTNSSTISPSQSVTLRLNSASVVGATSYATLTIDNSTYGWSVLTSLPLMEYLIVAGGGGGGASTGSGWSGAGGGAGGLIYNTTYLSSNTSYPVVVGLGGAGGTSGSPAIQGRNSSFNGFIAIGGGLAGSPQTGPANGGSGGSGGGSASAGTGGSGVAGQGYRGGNIGGGCSGGASGGGGAGGAAADGCSNGGLGLAINISGTLVNYSKGGYGGVSVANSGNGGNPGPGGGSAYSGDAGVVIIRYLGTQIATGGNITSVGGYTIHKFTTNGTFTLS